MSKFRQTALSLVLAASLWIVIFVVHPVNFWALLSVSTLVLIIVSVLVNRDTISVHPKAWAILVGVSSGFALYLVFYVGFQLTKSIPIFNEGITNVYDFGPGTPSWIVAMLLVFPIGPGEEIYWRGLVQKRFMERIGARSGFLFTVTAYTLVHLPALNVPLMLTAFVGGLAWGYTYKATGSLAPTIISHVLFDVLIFSVAPFS